LWCLGRVCVVLLVWVCSCHQAMLNDDGISALGTVFHVDCFVCQHCDTPFRDKPYYVRNGHAYCKEGYLLLFGKTVCAGCMGSFRKGDVAMEAVNKVRPPPLHARACVCDCASQPCFFFVPTRCVLCPPAVAVVTGPPFGLRGVGGGGGAVHPVSNPPHRHPLVPTCVPAYCPPLSPTSARAPEVPIAPARLVGPVPPLPATPIPIPPPPAPPPPSPSPYPSPSPSPPYTYAPASDVAPGALCVRVLLAAIWAGGDLLRQGRQAILRLLQRAPVPHLPCVPAARDRGTGPHPTRRTHPRTHAPTSPFSLSSARARARR
jgi:hypothetical protein